MNQSKNILICPLEWGLGHAARMIPLARSLMELNNNIIIGSGEEHLALFRSELPGLTYINFSGFKPGYSRYLPQYLILLLKTPFLLFHIIREHLKLKRIIREYSIDIVISDNRFGLWNNEITSVYVTHMPRIPFPGPFKWLEWIGEQLHRAIIKKYSLCFIPDLPGDLNVSGRLSHGIGLPENVRYTGILSRFISSDETSLQTETRFNHNTLILSGPEPQRSMLKQKLVCVLKDSDTPMVILEGLPQNAKEIARSVNIISYNHLPASQMKEMITSSNSIICRSGYTTIMDLISLNRTALLIPTPGQTEQEYLASALCEKGWFCTLSQKEIREGLPLPGTASTWPAEIVKQSKILLKVALKELLENDHKNRQPEKTGKKSQPDLQGIMEIQP